MKNKLILMMFLMLPLLVVSQEDVQLIQPIVEQPNLNERQMKAMRNFNAFRNWGIQKIGIDSVMNKSTGKGIRVCIADTGKPVHRDLDENILFSKNFTTDETDIDGNGHSTHVSGIVKEIAPDASLIIAKVLTDAGSGSNATVAEGIEWCIYQGADVINLSLGSQSPSAVIKKAIDYAVSANVLVVAAAGNEGQSEENTMGYPALWEETLAVGSINQNLKVSSFSSSGVTGDLVAPGEKILSTWKTGNYAVLSGTSMAAPFVSGVAALYIDVNKNTEGIHQKIEALFEGQAQDMLPEGYDRYSFFGHITPTIFSLDSIPDQGNETPVTSPPTKVGEWWSEYGKYVGYASGLIALVAGLLIFFKTRQ